MDILQEPRRSARQKVSAPNLKHVTATATRVENVIPGDATAKKSNRTAAAKKGSAGMLAEATQEAVKSSKRKATGAKNSESTKNSKKQKVEPADPREHVIKEANRLLGPLLEDMGGILDAASPYKDEPWYKELNFRHKLIPVLSNNLRTLEDMANRDEMKPFKFPLTFPDDEIPETYQYSYNTLKTKYNDLENLRKEVIARATAFESASPSEYCMHGVYAQHQADPRSAVRDGRTALYRAQIALELLHHAFRTFTYWVLAPLTLPGSSDPDPRLKSLSLDEDAFIRICQTVNTLHYTMPDFFASHDERLQAFLDAIIADFPADMKSEYEWHKEQPPATGLTDEGVPVPAPKSRFRVDLVYRHKKTLVPAIYLEVKQDVGVGGNPFWQNHRLYQDHIKKCPTAHYNGAPIFFVQLAGTFLSIGGGFCDALNQPPIVLQFGGQVNLQSDSIGRNFQEAVATLWALRQAIRLIPSQLATVDSQHAEMDAPRFKKSDNIEITKTLFTGVLYLAKTSVQEPGREHDINEELVLKIIYSRVAKERYGRPVQNYLADHDMAPWCYRGFSRVFEDLPGPSLEICYMMRYLRPPTQDEPTGWLTLHEFGQRSPHVAASSKAKIKEALNAIISVLEEKSYVHGDLRTNNVMIQVKLETLPDGTSMYTILSRPSSSLPYLMVIDFDWSGVAGQVYYPATRNPDVCWPGRNGRPIMISHDREMIDSWMASWPPVESVQNTVNVATETTSIRFEEDFEEV